MAEELLLEAASADDIDEVVRLVVEDGVDINVQDANGDTALHKAADMGSVRLIEALVSLGAMLDAAEIRTLGGATPLVLAARRGHLECVHILADSGAEVNVVSILDKSTPLHEAAAAGMDYMVKYLLSAGADTGLRDINGYNASYYAQMRGHTHIVAITGMPPPMAPMLEEKMAYQSLKQQQFQLVTGAKPEKKATKKKK